MTGFLVGIFSGGGGKIYCYFFCYAIVFGPNFKEMQKFSGGGGRPPVEESQYDEWKYGFQFRSSGKFHLTGNQNLEKLDFIDLPHGLLAQHVHGTRSNTSLYLSSRHLQITSSYLRIVSIALLDYAEN